MTSPFYRDDESSVLPAALVALTDLRTRGLDHRYVRHIRSSQAFALNLFAPLNAEGVRAIFLELGVESDEVELPVFEFEDEHDRLAETSERSKHRTQVDVVLRATDTQGRRIAVLIEVKFTEIDFGHCTAHASPANPRTDVCDSPGLFGGQPENCFQLLNHGHGQRRYADYLIGQPTELPQGPSEGGGCSVMGSLNQPMRNIALAYVLLDEGEADLVIYVLCAPTGHSTIWRRFEEVRSGFPATKTFSAQPLTAEHVADCHPDSGASLRTKYPHPILDD